MPFVPRWRRSEACLVAMLQSVALAVFLLGIRPQGSLGLEGDLPERKNRFITPADYVDTVANSQDTQTLDGQQPESALATKSFDAVEPDPAVLLSLSHGQLTYRNIHIDFSLIRSPPIEAPVNRL